MKERIMDDIKKYDIEQTIIDIEAKKNQMIANCREMERLYEDNKNLSNSIDGYDPLSFKYNQYYSPDNYEKYINRMCWRYIVGIFDLQKYMLCSEYDKMMKKIEENDIPDFNRETVLGWIAGLKQLIHDNLNTLVKQVFEQITKEKYYTGPGGWNGQQKKRNNNGVDKFFILTTCDFRRVFGYYHDITITDDLEKCLYILAGKQLPEESIKDIMRKEKVSEYENEIWKIKVCKNGNTHYWINDEKILNLLNRIGSGGETIGENIKIKVFPSRFEEWREKH